MNWILLSPIFISAPVLVAPTNQSVFSRSDETRALAQLSLRGRGAFKRHKLDAQIQLLDSDGLIQTKRRSLVALAAVTVGLWLLKPMLFRVSATNALIFAITRSSLWAVVVAACSRRATKIHPVEALRCE